ncbi:MAG TPA: hypothetical protein VGR05_05380, partial [Sphingomicrobium sp.]|nr:hypothetical protein [Sphingomicrobium sp.]
RQASTSDADEAKPGATTRTPAPSAQDMMYIASYEQPRARPTAVGPVKMPKTPGVKPLTANSAKVATADALAPLPAPKAAAKAVPPRGASETALVSSKTKVTGTPR